jgi:hypothetical protein
MIVMMARRSGGFATRFHCAVCETPATTLTGWQALVSGGGTEPVVVCAQPTCAAEVHRDWPQQTWQHLPLEKLVVDLALRYGTPRRSWRCRVCTSPQRAAIDQALVERVPQRQVAEQFKLTKTQIASHAIGHLPVTAMLATGRG